MTKTRLTALTLSKNIFKHIKLLGFASFTIKGDVNEGQIQTTFIDFMFFSLNVLVGILLSFISFHYTNDSTQKSLIINFGSILTTNGGILVGLNWMIVSFIVRYNIWKIITNLHAVDKKVSLQFVTNN